MSNLNNTSINKVYWWYDKQTKKYYAALFGLLGQFSDSVEIDRFEDIESTIQNTDWAALAKEYRDGMYELSIGVDEMSIGVDK